MCAIKRQVQTCSSGWAIFFPVRTRFDLPFALRKLFHQCVHPGCSFRLLNPTNRCCCLRSKCCHYCCNRMIPSLVLVYVSFLCFDRFVATWDSVATEGIQHHRRDAAAFVSGLFVSYVRRRTTPVPARFADRADFGSAAIVSAPLSAAFEPPLSCPHGCSLPPNEDSA